jgi:preprotein translocase subunit SecF
MKRIFRFTRYFLPTAIFSSVLVILGLGGYVLKGGFNLGVDFQAGLIQEIQFAPQAFTLAYTGPGNAVVSLSRNGISLVITGIGVEGDTYQYPFAEYGTIDALTAALRRVSGVTVNVFGSGSASSNTLIQNAQSNPQLGSEPYGVHYLPPGSAPVSIEAVRDALDPLSEGTVSVQVLGEPGDRRFMIRMEDQAIAEGAGSPGERIITILESTFGVGQVAVTRSDYVGSRFSKNLTDQAGILLGLTLLLILVYASIRFRPQFACGAVLAIIHDGIVIVSFVVWTGMEFNTTTIAAVLTILGYSINDTIVIFDRIRETQRIYPDDTFPDILDRDITETLSRTFITTLTTMLAVLSLYIFTTGSMKDFALALLVGMVSGVYSTIFIASGFVNLWDKVAKKRAAKRGVEAIA